MRKRQQALYLYSLSNNNDDDSDGEDDLNESYGDVPSLCSSSDEQDTKLSNSSSHVSSSSSSIILCSISSSNDEFWDYTLHESINSYNCYNYDNDEESSFASETKHSYHIEMYNKSTSKAIMGKRQVRFHNHVNVRQYNVVVGANILTRDTCPMQLSWEHCAKDQTKKINWLGHQYRPRKLCIQERREKIASLQQIAVESVITLEQMTLLLCQMYDLTKNEKATVNMEVLQTFNSNAVGTTTGNHHEQGQQQDCGCMMDDEFYLQCRYNERKINNRCLKQIEKKGLVPPLPSSSLSCTKQQQKLKNGRRASAAE
jgi:hypothetical protein